MFTLREIETSFKPANYYVLALSRAKTSDVCSVTVRKSSIGKFEKDVCRNWSGSVQSDPEILECGIIILNDWNIVFIIVSASRSPPGQAPKRLDFWLIFAMGELFGVIFDSFFFHWKHFGNLGPKSGFGHQRCPKRRQHQNKLSFWDRFGSGFAYFLICWLCFSASFFVELQGPFFMDLGCMLTPVFWHFCTLLRASCFSDILHPFDSKTRFSKVR